MPEYSDPKSTVFQWTPVETHLFFDPSSNNLGWAVFSRGLYAQSGNVPLGFTDVPSERVARIALSAHVIVRTYEPKGVTIEVPAVAFRGKKMENDRQIRACGAVEAACAILGVPVQTLCSSEWKGRTPKADHVRLFKQRAHKEPASNDESDAACMGWWHYPI